jgi:general secretion pathway protein E
MIADLSSQFAEHLRQNNHLTQVDDRDDAAEQGGSDRRSVKLWERTDLSASEFADVAARFHGLERIALQDLLSAVPLAASFSQRFLREIVAYPHRSPDGIAVLAVADPTNMAARRARCGYRHQDRGIR